MLFMVTGSPMGLLDVISAIWRSGLDAFSPRPLWAVLLISLRYAHDASASVFDQGKQSKIGKVNPSFTFPVPLCHSIVTIL